MTNSEQNSSTHPDNLPGVEDREKVEARFFTAAAGTPPTDEQRATVAQLRAHIVDLALVIEAFVPPGRNKSLALTALEDVQMRANRALFAKGPSA